MWPTSSRALATVLVTLLGNASALNAALSLAGQSPSVSFRNDVMAVLSKAGCNAGACHGNANGKAGFKLSLRGQDPALDHHALTRELFGRRINPLDPEGSLILLKATTSLAHEGGRRFDRSAREYELLRGWIADGALDDGSSAPALSRLEVEPRERVVVEPDDAAQISVHAVFDDGRRVDVSRLAVYETGEEAADISIAGRVKRLRTGEVTVLVRYLDQQAPVRLAFVPARPDFVWTEVPAENFVDEHVMARLKALRMLPSGLCTDGEFARRAWLDLLGVLPTAGEARQFVTNSHPQKRAYLINELLERPEFADFWALKWSDLLKNEEKVLDRKGVQNFHHWIRQSIATNKPLDQFARELVAATGGSYTDPASNYYRANRDPIARAEATAQLFLGARVGCAKCHNHPFDRWTQADYYDWAEVFSRVDYKIRQNRRRDDNDQHEFIGDQVVYTPRRGNVTNPKTGSPAKARFLGMPAAEPWPTGGTSPHNRLDALASWLTAQPIFAEVHVNRVWFHLLGRGLVEPIDDFRATNPASHPGLLKALSEDFVKHDFDLRHVIRLIMNSRTYQLSAQPNDGNGADVANFSHALVRRLSAEQLLDAQHQVTGVPPHFSGYPVGLRAGQIPGVRAVRARQQKLSPADMFLNIFGKPARLLSCECERTTETSLAQTFNLISGPAINEMLRAPENRLTTLLASMPPADILDELYWTALTRPPAEAEVRHGLAFTEAARNSREAWEDLTWALLNSKEFILRH